MKIFKLLAALLAGVVVLVIVLAIIGFTMLDRAARAGIEYGGTYALGVPTTLAAADVRPFAGEFELADLKVANPEGFDSPHFMRLGAGAVALDLSTIRSEVVELPTFTLDSVDVHLLKREGESNYQVILDNLKRFESGDKPKPSDPQGTSKKVAIRELAIRNVNVHVDVLPVGGAETRLEVAIPEITLTDLGTGDEKPLEIAAVIGVVTKAILQAVIETAGADLPGALLNDLQGGLGELASLGDMGVGFAADTAGAAVEGLGEGAGKAAEQAGEAVEDVGKGVQDAAEGVKDLIGGKKDDGDEGG